MCYWTLKTSTTRYWRNLCIRQNFFESNYQLIINVRKNVGNQILKESKSIHWLLTNNWWCSWKFGRLPSRKEKESVNSVWWYDSRY